MNHGPLIFLGTFVGMCLTWSAFVLGPVLQMGRQEVYVNATTGERLPSPKPGLAEQGRQVYRSQGCQYCHTQQVHGTGLAQGTNFFGYSGADMAQGWGVRPTVARDYIFDRPTMLGLQRVGQDLANIGARQTNAVWHYQHLYNPQTVSKGSVMPAYPFLFEKRKIEPTPSADALLLAPGEVEVGYEIVPKPEAVALVAYLLSLEARDVYYEAPLPLARAEAVADDAPKE